MSNQLSHKKIHPGFNKIFAFTAITMMSILISSILPVYGEPIVLATRANDSPLKQFKSGILAKDVQCNDGLQLVIKAKDGSPACVKPSSVAKLLLWAWANSTIENTQNSGEDQSSNKIITLEDDGKTVTLKKGESFLLKLGEDFNWSIDIDNQTVVSRVMNIMVVRGAQGVYEAHNSGQATLTGVGDPLCLTADPPCKIHSIQFKLNVVVTPTSDDTNSNGLVVVTEKDQYGIGEMINFTITNNGDARIFPNGWGYSIKGSDGKQYAPNGVLTMMIVALPTGNSIHWTWDQMDGNGIQVKPGEYTITASYTEENTQKQISSSKIIEIIG
ncbi:MAG TPA: hypothetical protein VLD38_01020 [Nitrosopumilaceae archaeon]|nr:hypothetical protein [Nitrosopumilaceae archaeon]